MQLHIHQILGAILGLYVWTLYARSVNDVPGAISEKRSLDVEDTDTSPDLQQRNASMLFPRVDEDPSSSPCDSVCVYTGPVSTGQKRSLVESDPRTSLWKRLFDFWPDENDVKGRDTFMVVGCNGLKAGEEIIPDDTQDKAKSKGESTAVSSLLQNSAFKFGMQQIYGCTMLFIVSHQRVYLGHFWEGQNFDRSTNVNADQSFQVQVINFLRRDYTTSTGKQQPALQQFAADFPAASTFAVILTKDKGSDPDNPTNQVLYPAKITAMAAEVSRLLGNLPIHDGVVPQGEAFQVGQVSTATYVATRKDKDGGQTALDTTAAGHMLFEYDPQGVGKRRQEQRAWRILWQRSQIMADQWT